MTTLLVKNPSQILSPQTGVYHGPGLSSPNTLTGQSIYIQDGFIDSIAPLSQLESRAHADDAIIIDATNKAVIPGLIDSHSHLVFGGNRADEFAQRTAGATYEDIAAQGGGIARTVNATRHTSKAELKDLAHERLTHALHHGTTTMEVKSGYGLDLETELKMLEVVAELNQEHPVDLIPTFLGAHAIPKGKQKSTYIREVLDMLPQMANLASFCDVFCEQGYFTPAETIAILEEAKRHGMSPRLHANQFHSIGCIEAAIELGAASVDHLEVLTDEEIDLLAKTNIACVMLPGVSLFLDIPFAPGRRIIDAGCSPVLASDFNPGSNMSMSLQMVMSLACMRMGISVPEALACVTQNAARALQLEKVGCIEEGWQADLLILHEANYEEMPYFYGKNHAFAIIKKGMLV